MPFVDRCLAQLSFKPQQLVGRQRSTPVSSSYVLKGVRLLGTIDPIVQHGVVVGYFSMVVQYVYVRTRQSGLDEL